MPADEQVPSDLGKQLAPTPEIFDIVEEGSDPLAVPNPVDQVNEVIEVPENPGQLEDVVLEEPALVSSPDYPAPKEEPELVLNEGDPYAIESDHQNPELVESILAQARSFTTYSHTSVNSVRRAMALCDVLETQLVEGVTADAVDQRLSLADLQLLDSIQEGLQTTKIALAKLTSTPSGKQIKVAGPELIYYDPFCATIARILINAQVSGGKKVQDIFAILKKKHDIDDREELMVSQIMRDMGYPVRSLIDGSDMIEQHYA